MIKIFNQKRAHNLIFEQKLLIFERKQLIFKKILIVEYGCKVIVLSIRRKSHLSGNVTIPWYLKPDLKISCFLFVSKIAHRKPVQNDKPMSSFIKIFFVYFQNLKFSEILEILKIFSTRKFWDFFSKLERSGTIVHSRIYLSRDCTSLWAVHLPVTSDRYSRFLWIFHDQIQVWIFIHKNHDYSRIIAIRTF